VQNLGLGEKQIPSAVEGRKPRSQRKGRETERGAHSGMHRRTFPQNHWLGKHKELISLSSCNYQGLNTGVLKVSWLCWDRALRVLSCSWSESRHRTGQTAWKQQSEECLGHTEGRLFAPLGVPPRESAFTEMPLWGQKSQQAPFPSPTIQHKHRATCWK